MMKYKFFLFSFFFWITFSAHAQIWVDKKFSYDSLLNIHYGSSENFLGNSELLDMDIYLPSCAPGKTRPRPLILWIHGGAFLAGTKNDANIDYFSKQFARRGYVTATINYRLGFVTDTNTWSCNYPNYPCVFAADTSEWHRAFYRAVQDGKGALRYLINRYREYNIDTANIFVAGESAGAFVALGVGLMDTILERPQATYKLSSLPKPATNTLACPYFMNKTIPVTIPRPDLGEIDGEIEPTVIHFSVKGIGNMYGAMTSDLLRLHRRSSIKPSIYSFHQPCDIVVPIDSDRIFWGLSWCMTNGYNCYAIKNTPMIFGSRTISQWNAINHYGYDIEDHFTNVNFPYNFLFGTSSCLDQVNNPCHAFDNLGVRENELAVFFARLNSNKGSCETINLTTSVCNYFQLSPNPVTNQLKIIGLIQGSYQFQILDLSGRLMINGFLNHGEESNIDIESLNPGFYFLQISHPVAGKSTRPFMKI